MSDEKFQSILESLQDHDGIMRSSTLRILDNVKDPDLVEDLCDYLLKTDDPKIRNICIEHGYKPVNKIKRALFYFVTCQWEKYEDLDFQNGKLLKEAYWTFPKYVRKMVLEVAEANKKGYFVENVLIHGNFNKINKKEWTLIIKNLKMEEKYDQLWDLIFRAPPNVSNEIFKVLNEVGYTPCENDKVIWKNLKKHPYHEILDTERKLQHPDWVSCLGFSPDGKFLATGCKNGSVKVIETDNLTLKTEINHHNNVKCLEFSPDGGLLVTGSWDGTVKIMDNENFKIQKEIQHRSLVCCLGFSPDGRFLATGSSDGTVRVIETTNFTVKYEIKHEDSVRCLGFSPDGRFLATGSRDSTIKILDMKNLRERRIKHKKWVLCLGFSPDGRFLVTGVSNGLVRIIDTDNFQVRRLIKHDEWISSLGFSPDGKFLATGSWDGIVRIIDTDSFKLHKVVEHNTQVCSLGFSPDCRLLAVGFNDGMIQVVDLENFKVEKQENFKLSLGFTSDGALLTQDFRSKIIKSDFKGITHRNRVKCLGFSPDGRFLATGGDDKMVKISEPVFNRPLNSATGQDLRRVKEMLNDIDISPYERNSLIFLRTLMEAKLRFDVLIEEILIKLEDYDVIIEEELQSGGIMELKLETKHDSTIIMRDRRDKSLT